LSGEKRGHIGSLLPQLDLGKGAKSCLQKEGRQLAPLYVDVHQTLGSGSGRKRPSFDNWKVTCLS
ncbi:MAG: hypothetical protein ACK5O3_17020, partial [Burkholderiales bacterium]